MNRALLSLMLAAAATVPSLAWEDQAEYRVPQIKRLYLDLSAGSYTIVAGTSSDTIKVRWSADRGDAQDARVRLDATGSEATLRARGPRNNFRVEVEVPRELELDARLSVGELDVRGVVGHKTLSCRIGEIKVGVPNVEAYARAEARATIGDISSGPFGRTSSGFFRSFHWEGKGTYRLDARVGIGEVRFTEDR